MNRARFLAALVVFASVGAGCAAREEIVVDLGEPISSMVVEKDGTIAAAVSGAIVRISSEGVVRERIALSPEYPASHIACDDELSVIAYEFRDNVARARLLLSPGKEPRVRASARFWGRFGSGAASAEAVASIDSVIAEAATAGKTFLGSSSIAFSRDLVAVSGLECREPRLLLCLRDGTPVRFLERGKVRRPPSDTRSPLEKLEGVCDRAPTFLRYGWPFVLWLRSSSYWSGSHLVFSPDGSLLVEGNGDGGIRTWDTASGTRLSTWFSEKGLAMIALSPSGELVASTSGDDDAVTLRETRTGEVVARLEGHEGWITGLAFLRDRVVSSGSDGTIRIWPVPSRRSP